MTGAVNENIFEILADIQHYEEQHDKTDQAMCRWIATQALKGAGLFNVIETPKTSTNEIKCGKMENATVKAKFGQLIKKYDITAKH